MEGLILQEQCWDAFERRDHKEAVRLLPSQDPDIDLYEPGLLYYSIRNGWLDVTRDLITNYHFNPRQYYLYGEPYLYTAVKGNHVDIVEYLIKECGCDPMIDTTVTVYVSVPVLHYVASEGLLDVLKCMVMNINGHIMDEQYRDTNGQTVLHRAIKHIDVVKYLIDECDCDIMTPDKDGNTILHYVASKRLLNVLKYLINTHHYPMTTNNSGQTGAVKHIDVVKCLINECVMITDEDGVPFLHYVASEGLDLLDVLKCMVMNINGHIMDEQYCDTHGRTVLHCAVKHIDVVKYLINECNCDIMATDKNGNTILHYAASEGLLDVLKCMVMNINGHIMDEQYRDTNGQTVLHRAIKHIDVVKYLIDECDCDIMTPDKDGNTILHYVASKRLLNVFKYLIDTHHYPMTTNNSGQTGAVKHIDVVKCLINECVMITDKDGVPFLHYVASEGLDLLDVLKCMVININGHIMDEQYRDTNGQTVLHCAVKHIDVVKYLINECNCDIMTTNNRGETVLHHAVGQHYERNLLYYSISNGWLDATRDLITNYHFDPHKYYKGESFLYIAVKSNHVDIVKYLIKECGCDPMMHTTWYGGVPVLHYVASEGLLDVLKCMVMNINGHIMDKQYRDTIGQTVLHPAVEHIDVVKYLINEFNCDIMTPDNNGLTPLHHAVRTGTAEVIEYFLSTGNYDFLAKDNEGKTPLHLAKERGDSDIVIGIFKKFGNIKISHPIDSYVNVLLVGNPGAGKSTLSHVINDTATGSIVLGYFRNVGGVVPCTAGIIPYKLQHEELGNIILHDFAGHSKYYSSHSAVINNLLQGSGGVFLIVVSILEKEAVKQLHQWLTVVRNEAQKALNECHVIVIVSHVDEIFTNPFERRRRKEEIQEIIVKEKCDSVLLDCRKLGGSGVDSFFNKLSIACESIRSTSGKHLSLYCHMMYGLLEERKENILTLSDVMSAGKYNNDYVIPDKREDILDALDLLHSTGLISVLKSEYKVWVVVNKGILLTEVDGILFAPKTFKEHVDLASNTGIVSVSGLTRLFPKYDPDMLICFLKNMELCQELDPSFLRTTNLIAGDREETGDSASETQRRGERLLFFPCLLTLLHSDDDVKKTTSEVYQFGWCLQCTRKHNFFPPRYFHVLSLHLAFKMAQPQENDKLRRRCTFWKNGVYWFNGHGVGSLVEIVDESQCVLVMMSCEKGYSDNMVSLRRDVIGEVMSVYKESCPSLEVKELVIDPKELAYPVNTPRERTVYSVKDILSAINKREEFLVKSDGTKGEKVKEILPDESLSDISNLSLLGGKVTVIRNTHHHHYYTILFV